MNTINRLKLYLLLASIWLSGCATTDYIPVHEKVIPAIESTDVKIGFNQEEIYIKFNQSTNGSAATAQFGLIGALIGSAIDSSANSTSAKEAEKDVKPIRDAMIDTNLNQQLFTAINAELKNVSWLKANNGDVNNPFNHEKIKEITKNSDASAVLVISLNYYLTHLANEFIISAKLTLYPSSTVLQKVATNHYPEQDDEEVVLYKNEVMFGHQLLAKFDQLTREAAIKEWLKDDNKQLKVALKEGVTKMANMIVAELSRAAKHSATAEPGNNKNTDAADNKVVSVDSNEGS